MVFGLLRGCKGRSDSFAPGGAELEQELLQPLALLPWEPTQIHSAAPAELLQPVAESASPKFRE